MLGVLSQTDLLSLSAGVGASDLARLQYVGGEPRDAPPLSLRSSSVGAALPERRPLIAVPAAAPLPEAAALMLHHGVHTLPVVALPGEGHGGASAEQALALPQPPQLLGVVSRADILRAVLEAAEAEQDVIAPEATPQEAAGAWHVQRLEHQRAPPQPGGAAPAARYYAQTVQPAKGGSGYVRTARWGRVGGAREKKSGGSAPQREDAYASFADAEAVLQAATRAKLRKGYALVRDERSSAAAAEGAR